MRDYLLFRLYGAMASWGDIAVGEYRPSFAHPSKSAVLGLVAAALGIKRDEEETFRRMETSCGFAVLVDAPGSLLRDYHTIQTAPARKGVIHYTRKDELSAETLGTILSSRDYYCDALYAVCLWIKGDEFPFSLEEIKAALLRPCFTLYLGRKSCPLSMPLQPQILSASSIMEVLRKTEFKDAELLKSLPRKDTVSLYSEDRDNAGIDMPYEITRRDSVLSRKRWQFENRTEHMRTMNRTEM